MSQQLLIIDDDRAMHALISADLAGGQTNCISAMNGADGIQQAIEARPSAILLDMDMPGMNGMEVCRQLKANPQTRQIPVLFLTADRATGSKVKGMDLGAVDYVTKPFDRFELRARVRSAVRMSDEMDSAHAEAGTDESTGIWSRKSFVKQMEMTVAAASRTSQSVTCCLASIDRFDELAAKTGQPGGEDLMREAAERIGATVRLEDIVCRYSKRVLGVLGLVPEQKLGRILAERLRSCVGEIGLRSFFEPENVTFSVGLAISRASPGPTILRTAERALAEAQSIGNRIVLLHADSIQDGASDNPIN